MMFWIISISLSALIAVFLLAVLWAKSAQLETTAPTLLIYTQQLQEVEKDVAKGLLAEDEAERLKIEISRRILALDATDPAQTFRDTPALRTVTGGIITLVLLCGTFLMYREHGAPGYENLSQKQRIANAQLSMETRPSLEEFAASNEALRKQLDELIQWKVRGKMFKQDNDKLRNEINTLSKDYWGRPKKLDAKPSTKNIQQDDYIKNLTKSQTGNKLK